MNPFLKTRLITSIIIIQSYPGAIYDLVEMFVNEKTVKTLYSQLI